MFSKRGFPGGSAGKESTCNAGDPGLISGLGRSPGERGRLPTPVFLGFPGGSVGKSCLQGRRPGFDSWVGKIPWRKLIKSRNLTFLQYCYVIHVFQLMQK